jgi:hypothetical protein
MGRYCGPCSSCRCRTWEGIVAHALAVGVEHGKYCGPFRNWQFCCLSYCTVTARRHCTIRCTADRVISTVVIHSLVLNTLLNWVPSKCTVSLQRSVSVTLPWHCGNYIPFLQRRCIKMCIVLCFGTVTDGGRWKGTCWEMLHSAECEMLRWKCEWLQAFEYLRQLICNIY